MTAQQIKNKDANDAQSWQRLTQIARILTNAGKTTAKIQIKRSYNCASWRNAPLEVVSGKKGPKLCGLPYLKTNFNGKGGFRRTLYTDSTMRIEVGANWKPNEDRNVLRNPEAVRLLCKLTANLL